MGFFGLMAPLPSLGGKTPFKQQDVSPASGERPVRHAAEPFAGADDAEAGGGVQLSACGVLGEDPRLDGPGPAVGGGSQQCGEEALADAVTAGGLCDVDGVLNDPAVHATPGPW